MAIPRGNATCISSAMPPDYADLQTIFYLFVTLFLFIFCYTFYLNKGILYRVGKYLIIIITII